jgi:hypothetical protein
MTAQITDTFELDGTSYSLVGQRGGPLFEPAAHGIPTRMMHTACTSRTTSSSRAACSSAVVSSASSTEGRSALRALARSAAFDVTKSRRCPMAR